MRSGVLGVAVAVACVAGLSARAEEGEGVEIELKTGERVKGTLVDFGERVYRVRVDGKVRTVAEEDVRSVRFGGRSGAVRLAPRPGERHRYQRTVKTEVRARLATPSERWTKEGLPAEWVESATCAATFDLEVLSVATGTVVQSFRLLRASTDYRSPLWKKDGVHWQLAPEDGALETTLVTDFRGRVARFEGERLGTDLRKSEEVGSTVRTLTSWWMEPEDGDLSALDGPVWGGVAILPERPRQRERLAWRRSVGLTETLVSDLAVTSETWDVGEKGSDASTVALEGTLADWRVARPFKKRHAFTVRASSGTVAARFDRASGRLRDQTLATKVAYAVAVEADHALEAELVREETIRWVGADLAVDDFPAPVNAVRDARRGDWAEYVLSGDGLGVKNEFTRRWVVESQSTMGISFVTSGGPGALPEPYRLTSTPSVLDLVHLEGFELTRATVAIELKTCWGRPFACRRVTYEGRSRGPRGSETAKGKLWLALDVPGAGIVAHEIELPGRLGPERISMEVARFGNPSGTLWEGRAVAPPSGDPLGVALPLGRMDRAAPGDWARYRSGETTLTLTVSPSSSADELVVNELPAIPRNGATVRDLVRLIAKLPGCEAVNPGERTALSNQEALIHESFLAAGVAVRIGRAEIEAVFSSEVRGLGLVALRVNDRTFTLDAFGASEDEEYRRR